MANDKTSNGQKISEERNADMKKIASKIFIGFKKSKNLNLSARRCMSFRETFMYVIGELNNWSHPVNSKKAIKYINRQLFSRQLHESQ